MKEPSQKLYPPSDREIEDYAAKVCQTISAKTNDPRMQQSDVVSGLAGFLKLAARIVATNRNKQHRTHDQ